MLPQDHTHRLTIADVRPGDFLWRTPASSSFTVATHHDDGTTVEITGVPSTDRPDISTPHVWLPSSAPARVSRPE
jgi:hypothetical protein